jgi:PAS domain S-box-containing protein
MNTNILLILALEFLIICSRYYLIPDGPLRKIRVLFFSYLGIYTTFLFLVDSLSLKLWEYTLFSLNIGLCCILAYFIYVLEHYWGKIQQYDAEKLRTPLELVGIKVSLHLNVLWVSSNQSQKLFGRPAEEMIGKPLASFLYDAKETIALLKTYIEDPGIQNAPTSLRLCFKYRKQKNMTRRWFLASIQKEPSEILTIGLKNITEQVFREEFYSLLKMTMDEIQIGITIVDAYTKKIIYINHQEAELHGYSINEMLGKNSEIFAPVILQNLTSPIMSPGVSYISLNRDKNGKIFPVRLTKTEVTYGDQYNKHSAKVTFCQELSLNFPLPKNETLVIMLRSDGRIQWINDFCFEFYGQQRNNWFPEQLTQLFSPESTANILDLIHNFSEFPRKYQTVTGKTVCLSFYKGTMFFLIGQEWETL